MIIGRGLVRALSAVSYHLHLPRQASEGGDVLGEMAALQLTADEADGDNDPLSQLWVLLLSQPDRLDEAGKASHCIAPRRFEDVSHDPRHLHGVVGRASPCPHGFGGVKDGEVEEPLRIAGGGDAYRVIDYTLREQPLQEPCRHTPRGARRAVLVCIPDVGGEVVASLWMMADPRNIAIKRLTDRVLVLVMVCKWADLNAEATFGGAWGHFDRVILAVPVPCHLKGFFWAEGGAETAADAK